MRLSSLSSTRRTVFPFGFILALAPFERAEVDPSPGPAGAPVFVLTVCSNCDRIMQKSLPRAKRATGEDTFPIVQARFLPAWRVESTDVLRPESDRSTVANPEFRV